MRTVSRSAALLLLAAIFLPMRAGALEGRIRIAQYGHRSWGLEDGLPQSSVQAIAQTTDGYMWLGTQYGLARFDGSRFTNFSAADTPALRTPNIWALLADTGGGLWIGTAAGLVHYTNGLFLTDRAVEAAGVTEVFAMDFGVDGSLWMATNIGVVHRKRGGAVLAYRFATNTLNQIPRALAVDRLDRVWVGTDAGLTTLKDKQLVAVEPEVIGKRAVRRLFLDRHSRLWIGTTAGLFCRAGETVRPVGTRDLGTAYVLAISDDVDGNLWIGTTRGLVRMNERGTEVYSTAEGLTGTWVGALFEDAERTMWAGTLAGADQFRDTTFKVTGLKQGLQNDNVMSVYEDPHGILWLGTLSGLARRSRDGVFRWYSTHTGLSSDAVYSIASARGGGVWIGTAGGGLCHVTETTTRCYGTKDGLSNNIVASVYEDDDGAVWAGTLGGGLNVLRNGRFTVYGQASGFPSPRISHISRAAAGGVWVGMVRSGLVRFAGGRVVERIVPPPNVRLAVIRGMIEDPDGTLWIAVTGLGFLRYRKGELTVFAARDLGMHPNVHQIVDDRLGHLWMSTNDRIFRFSRKELNDFADHRSRVLVATPFGMESGLHSTECNGAEPSGILASDGTLWFGTMRGVVNTDPAKVPRSLPPPTAIIESAEADGRLVTARNRALAPETNRITFRYTATALTDPQLSRFRYRLEGFDSAWINASTARTAVYTNLPPRDYRFIVQASRDGNVWNGREASFAFRRQPRFTETLFFDWACALGAFILIAVAHQVRMAGVRRREAILVRRVADQTAEIRTAKDAAERAARTESEMRRHRQWILDSAAEGIVGLDPAGVPTFVNPAAAAMLGWPVDDLADRSLHAMIHDPADAAATGLCVICGGEAACRASATADFRLRDGRVLPVEYSVNTLRGEPGEESGIVVTFRDISERQALQRMKDEFVATVSHELRTPLTAIRGSLGLLGGGLLGALTEKGVKMVQIAVTNTDRLIRLINDILDLERIEGGKIELVPATTSSAALMNEAAESVRAFAGLAGVTLQVDPSDVPLWVDHDRMVQTLINLLSNAIKFSPSGDTVTLSGAVNGSAFTFRVEDHGRGIPEGKLEKIFGRFEQVDASDARQNKGTGLGLAICQSIVNAHRGRIWAENRPEGGSLFQIEVPLPPATAEAA